MKKLGLLCLILLTAYACDQACGCSPIPPANFTGQWKFIGYVREDSLSVLGPARRNTFGAVVEFTGRPDSGRAETFRLLGRGAVNSLVGSYRTAWTGEYTGPLTIPVLGSTKMAGTPEEMRFEQTYFERLKNAAGYEIGPADRFQIKLSAPAGETMLFQRAD